MKINIGEAYGKNVSNKYGYEDRKQYEKDFTSKERNMWLFAAVLMKNDDEQFVFDTEKDRQYLESQLKCCLGFSTLEPFTLDEWFKYMEEKSK